MRPAHFLASVVTAAAAVIALANPASAAPINYVALGDSYASGLGTGSYDGASGGCKRGPLAYPALYAAATAPATFKSVACSGARTGDVITQAGNLTAATNLVTVQVGGNDAGFTDVITTCTFGSDQDCVNRVNQAKTYAANTLPGLLTNVYNTIKSKSPSARVVVLGYPRLYKVPGSCNVGLSDTKRAAINSGSDALHNTISARAGAAGFRYVDVRGVFTGHEICSSSWWLNSLSWPVEESYHPNRAGHQSGYLPALRSAVG
ncbi:GDSL-like Lipase/Acylhydrolase family protein [Lentzea albidocapillata subsp. violacea]|uniref:GDSL-like Lipase/Acylhydrolase family protein n=1 Tax=Lentzea albidocapillata subsp. violacea TaxID=128104 RepID=A0A1G8X8I1_9PSEU|nr:SGNH/GDSL hydrolase family protein [Lentzea albidocapillata]SDJ86050.1 GDSL-like Lipase/Acylhydrolase family protein [Lentzea albidocapillata subsp. violacea]